MGHQPGSPCVYEDQNHDGRCRTLVVGPVVDHSRTRYFELGEGDKDYFRVNDTAEPGFQVEFRRQDGTWATARALPTVGWFLADIEGGTWREITAEEVPSGG